MHHWTFIVFLIANLFLSLKGVSYIIWKVFFRLHSEIDSVHLSVSTTIFKWIAGLCFYVECLMLYINGLVSTISFLIFSQKPYNFQKNNKARILIKLQCVAYEWICLLKWTLQTNEKLFSNYKLVFEILAKNQKIFNLIERCEYWSKCYASYNGPDYRFP